MLLVLILSLFFSISHIESYLIRNVITSSYNKMHLSIASATSSIVDIDNDKDTDKDGKKIDTEKFSSTTIIPIESIIEKLESKLLKPFNIDSNIDSNDKFDKIIRSLESQYMLTPIQTSQFLNYAICGKWKLIYSSFPTPKADNTLIYDIDQIINPGDGSYGEINNIINWKLERENDDACGKLTVSCSYNMTSRGGLEITLKDHILNVEKIPKNVQELLVTMQRTIPFEFFDPNEYIATNTFIDPKLKIVRMSSSDTITNLINIFIKAE